jgi:predicted component of type VI protein secretion system
MDVKLEIVDGEGSGREIPLTLPAVIGRSRSVGITIAHPLVSRQHCELIERDGQLIVRDLGSLNGTFIGDMRITEETLPPGGMLTVGQVTFQAVYGDVSPAADAQGQPTQDFFVTAKAKETATISETIEVEEPADSKTPTPQALLAESAATASDASPSAKNEDTEAADASKESGSTPAAKESPAAKGAPAAKESTPDFDFGAFSDEEPQEVASEDDDLNDFLKNLG